MFAGTETNHLGIRQIEILHQLDIFVDRLDLQARIEGLLLADGADRLALIVVSRINEGRIGQLQQPVEDRFILRGGSPL
jgi:hypothetical protein